MKTPLPVQLTTNLLAGPEPEPPVSNEEFLESFVRYGLWLRVLAAHRAVKALEDRQHRPSPLERVVHMTTISQSLGMFYEDLAANLTTWRAWELAPKARLADLVAGLRLNRNEKATPSLTYLEDVARELGSKGKASADPWVIARSLDLLKRDEAIVSTLGIPWKVQPSVKLVPKDRRWGWDTLPAATRELVHVMADKRKPLLTIAYNKLKHGPQFLVTDYKGKGMARGHSEETLRKDIPFPSVRLLYDGARTQEEPGELEASGTSRVAPFVVGDVTKLWNAFDGLMLPLAGHMCRLGLWLFRVKFGREIGSPEDPAVTQLVRSRNAQPRFFGLV